MLGLPDLTKLPQEIQDAVGPPLQTLVGAINALETKSAADVPTVIHGSLTESLADAKALEDPLLSRLDQIIVIGQKFSAGFDISVTPKTVPPV